MHILCGHSPLRLSLPTSCIHPTPRSWPLSNPARHGRCSTAVHIDSYRNVYYKYDQYIC